MEKKHNSNLRFKSFANGRSHLLQSPAPAPPSSSSSSEDDEHENDKSFRLGDSEVSFAGKVTVTVTANANSNVTVADGGGGVGGSVVLQDRESETESSRNPNVRRRSKRIRKQEISWFDNQRHFHQIDRYNKTQNQSQIFQSQINRKSMIVNESSLSSISNTSPEEDVAYCLMMLSRDRWTESESESEREIVNVKRTPARSKYRCDTCNKVFRSYQALGGHRASHKKIKLSHHNNSNHQSQNISIEDDKIYECAVCLKVFGSGQALGGHKRSHGTAKPVTKQRINLIDLNLPAPIEDDDISQVEVSVVSDGEFIKPH